MRYKSEGRLKMTRREVLKAGLIGGAGLMLPFRFFPAKAFAAPIAPWLNDPSSVDMFENMVPNALDPGFIWDTVSTRGQVPLYRVGVSINNNHQWGTSSDTPLVTSIFGYGGTWPGKTFDVQNYRPVQVQWENNLFDLDHLLPVDTSLHWCFSLAGYTRYSIAENGVPIVTHVHGHHSQYRSDGNPEEFFTPGWRVTGPRFRGRTSVYSNDQAPGTLWYHDHALGITRLNVYAGMAGFYFLRDEHDTGKPDNPLGLPAWPYEKAYAIQDRMFTSDGQLFYPAFPGDPAYQGFITDEGVDLTGLDEFPLDPNNVTGNGGGPTALAEFFGDHMLVNGIAWPKDEVEPRRYRLRLLNGCDSRFMVIRFRQAASLTATEITGLDPILPFTVIGSDQGLGSSAETVTQLVFEPGSRYDIIFDFSDLEGERIIMENIGGDEPFGGDIPGPQVFNETDRIMAFDVVIDLDTGVPDVFDPALITFGPDVPTSTRTRKLALFEGRDEFGRLQPLLGTAEPATDFIGRPINWPDTEAYRSLGLTGQMEGSIAWHSPTTENPALNTTEEWEIWNGTGDAHPIHLHLVHFEVLGRKEIVWDSHTTEEEKVIPNETWEEPAGDGTYLVTQPVLQHNGAQGSGFKFMNLTTGADVDLTSADGYVENARKDMVTALPGQVTYIKAQFDKPGRFVWHCHILSHEDHEMMRTFYVGPEF